MVTWGADAALSWLHASFLAEATTRLASPLLLLLFLPFFFLFLFSPPISLIAPSPSLYLSLTMRFRVWKSSCEQSSCKEVMMQLRCMFLLKRSAEDTLADHTLSHLCKLTTMADPAKKEALCFGLQCITFWVSGGMGMRGFCGRRARSLLSSLVLFIETIVKAVKLNCQILFKESSSVSFISLCILILWCCLRDRRGLSTCCLLHDGCHLTGLERKKRGIFFR